MIATVIIPYKVDRGWLTEAIKSVDQDNYELILAKGDANWPTNFNHALKQATGKYIKWLHEDDMLAFYGIQDSIEALERQKVDFVHGKAIELIGHSERLWIPILKYPEFGDLLWRNVIHSTTLLYKREVFEQVGLLNESDSVQSFEEYEFNLRCLKAGLKIGYCDSVVAFYRRHPKQLIRTTNQQERKANRKELINSYSL